MEGYWKFHRILQDTNLWLSEKFTRGQAWADLIGLANHTDGYIRVRGIRVKVKRGEVGWSERRLAPRWRWSRDKVRKFLAELNDDERIDHRKTNVSSLISITNYKQYQGNQTTDQTTDSPTDLTTEKPQKNHRPDPNKNEKNDKNEKNLNTPPLSPSKGKSVRVKKQSKYPDYPGFNKFYEAYPRKEGKRGALETWVKMGYEKQADEIISKVNILKKKIPAWVEMDIKHIKIASTFVNACGWEDADQTEMTDNNKHLKVYDRYKPIPGWERYVAMLKDSEEIGRNAVVNSWATCASIFNEIRELYQKEEENW